MSSSDQGIKVLSDNRRARHDYFLLEDMEAGMVLTGTEVKSIRAGKMQLRDAYATIRDHEMWLFNAHISPYSHGNLQNHDPLRPRKLLLNRREISRLIGKTHEKGLTLIPTRVYLLRGKIKCQLALAKAKKLYDKREKSRQREAESEARQAVREGR